MNFPKVKIGPAALVSAAFIGPGTVITCSLAGANYGASILWALIFGVITTIILQEMSGRLAIVRKLSLSESIRKEFQNSVFKIPIIFLVISAIGVGNAAYQSGNLTGAVIGADIILKNFGVTGDPGISTTWVLGMLIFILLFLGKYKLLEKVMISLVILMSIVFLLTLFFIDIKLSSILKGAFIPEIPDGSLYLVMGLIGTTVVPYNLFLHSSAIKDKGWGLGDIRISRLDTLISIGLGGIISIAVVITSASSLYLTGQTPGNLKELSLQLSPLLGSHASLLLSIGILAAGLTSSITAPLAASYTICGIFGKEASFRGQTFRITWIIVLLFGLIISSLGIKPLIIIQYAQFMNGLTLPFIAILLLFIINSPKMGKLKNGVIQNIISIIIIMVVISLGIRSLVSLFT